MYFDVCTGNLIDSPRKQFSVIGAAFSQPTTQKDHEEGLIPRSYRKDDVMRSCSPISSRTGSSFRVVKGILNLGPSQQQGNQLPGGEGANKRVSFPELPSLPPLSVKEIEPKTVEPTVKHEARKSAGSKRGNSSEKFERRVHRFKTLVTGLEIALDDLAETESGPLAEQSTALINEADPKIRSVLLSLLETTLKKDKRPAEVADVFAAATPEVEEYLRSVLQSMIDEATTTHLSASSDQLQYPTSLAALKLLELHVILANIRAECEQIEEVDPDRSSRVAAMYTAVYPTVTAHFDALRLVLESQIVNNTDQSIAVALAVASMGMVVLETAFSALNREGMTPIKVIDDRILIQRGIPRTLAKIGEIELSDAEAAAAIHRADMTIQGLCWLQTVLTSADAETGTVLLDFNLHMFSTDAVGILMEFLRLFVRQAALQTVETEEAVATRRDIEKEVEEVQQKWLRNGAMTAHAKACPIITDPVQARTVAMGRLELIAKTVVPMGKELIESCGQLCSGYQS